MTNFITNQATHSFVIPMRNMLAIYMKNNQILATLSRVLWIRVHCILIISTFRDFNLTKILKINNN